MDTFQEYLVPWIVSNVTALILLIIAYKKPKIARILFALLFAWACWINYVTAQYNPSDYLNYANFAPFGFMRDFILGWFMDHITVLVTVIAIGQGLIALGMLLKSWWVKIAGIGAMVFLLAITLLGLGSGFPSSITAALAMYFILTRDNLNCILKRS